MKKSDETALKLQAKYVIDQYVEYAKKLFFEDESVLNSETEKGGQVARPLTLSQACPLAFAEAEEIPWN